MQHDTMRCCTQPPRFILWKLRAVVPATSALRKVGSTLDAPKREQTSRDDSDSEADTVDEARISNWRAARTLVESACGWHLSPHLCPKRPRASFRVYGIATSHLCHPRFIRDKKREPRSCSSLSRASIGDASETKARATILQLSPPRFEAETSRRSRAKRPSASSASTSRWWTASSRSGSTSTSTPRGRRGRTPPDSRAESSRGRSPRVEKFEGFPVSSGGIPRLSKRNRLGSNPQISRCLLCELCIFFMPRCLLDKQDSSKFD